MMSFKRFKELQQEHFATMTFGEKSLFRVGVDKDELWNLYLDSFPEGTNTIYRQRREFDCSCCKHFIRSFGDVVAIDADYNLISIWDFDPEHDKFSPVTKALSEYIHKKHVENVLVTKDPAYGTDVSRELTEHNHIHVWHHFRLELPGDLVNGSRHLDIGKEMSERRTSKELFKRAMEKLSRNSIETVSDLIAEKVLYRGNAWKNAINSLLSAYDYYHGCEGEKERDYFCWRESVNLGANVTRIKNSSIGVLLEDLTNSVDIETALRRYESVVAPENYKRSKPVFTKQMVTNAEEKVSELGLLDSLPRRFAEIGDVSVRNVLWANRDASKHMDGVGGVFDMLREDIPVDMNSFKNATPIGIDEFVRDVLPQTSTFELLFDGAHSKNLMSLIAPVNKDSERLFSWNNGFTWSYTGNIADSSMKERVRKAGGDVNGVLRFSIQWNEENDNNNDFDAHCVEPTGNRIFYGNKRTRHKSSGMLDVDIINPGNRVAVENITWNDLGKMPEGKYVFYVHNFTQNNGRSGFRAEIEFNGQVYQYNYPHYIKNDEYVEVARIEYTRKNGFKFVKSLSSDVMTKDEWNIKTNRFHPVSAVMYSPNYWDEQTGHGNRHFFFMIPGCVNDERPNGFFNEYLRSDLREHRKVFEALGSKMKVGNSDSQLSGLGFSSTRRNSIIGKVDGKLMKIIF